MRANELMTGDLVMVNKDGVCIPKGTIVRVVEVDSENKLPEKGLVGAARCVDVNDRSVSGGIWCEYLSPIPLTQEILEKNGFGKDKNGDFVLIEDDCAVRVIRRGDVYAFTLVAGKVGITDMIRFTVHQVGPFSVHWVQHALKLCGIEKEIVL